MAGGQRRADLPPADTGSSSRSTSGVVTGGGFVDIDPESGRYSGALALDVFGRRDLAAIVVVDTQLAGDPDGWALFASILAPPSRACRSASASSLSGVGGCRLNRTMDAEALADGAADGAVDALLFPDDPSADAPLILALDAWFPRRGQRRSSASPRDRLGRADADLAASSASARRSPTSSITLLGSVDVVLPDETAGARAAHGHARRDRHVRGAVSIGAPLRLDAAGRRPAARRHGLVRPPRPSPYFLLSIGGYHPAFDPPAGPAAVGDRPRRMRVEVDLRRGRLVRARGLRRGDLEHAPVRRRGDLEASAKFL